MKYIIKVGMLSGKFFMLCSKDTVFTPVNPGTKISTRWCLCGYEVTYDMRGVR